ncbi:Cytochrome c [Anatilimnocola aggregata]|uniref:Cytochrome c n=1 Tax=Anatilimnocola aggregata TaxID=2528021 RepID=A0A517Y6M7_9BACT|nr:c-type cytochrome [Anatilimnocola aggregata]QDU25782.1 Cytochrome c [Anatilimnocola aggregata]
MRCSVPLTAICLLALLFTTTAHAADAVPEWIWATKKPGEGEMAFFRKTFDLKEVPAAAVFTGSCDNVFTLFVNAKHCVEHNTWEQPVSENVLKHLTKGKNIVALRCRNEGGPAGMLGELVVKYKDGSTQRVPTDRSWFSASEPSDGWQQLTFDDKAWKPAQSLGKLGIAPWAAIAWAGARPATQQATAPTAIQTLPSFEVELVYSVPKGEQGSWVSMTVDTKGRLITSDQGGSLYRVTPGQTSDETKVEKLSVPIGQAQGLLCVQDKLYVVVNGNAAQGAGLYRITDKDNNDEWDTVELMKKFQGGGEHGPHAVRLGPDGKLYVVAGNFTKIPAESEQNSPHRNWAEDLLLPRNPDGGGHDPTVMAPGGWVSRVNIDGTGWEVLCAGLRNSYDIAFNTDGEVFTFDSDMEWDTGTPWYRPTRVNHCVSAGEYGWRNGTGKWPEYSTDSLGAVVNIGMGSPTGVEFGTGAKFPAKYQRALFINDWTYGKIYAVHMTPTGGTYTGTFEPFVQGRPLPVTDICVHPDGCIYFSIGGRGTQSGIYRVKYTGSESTAPVAAEQNDKALAARELRRKLESFHGKQGEKALETAWPQLNSSDRAIRYAARVAVEHQPLSQWQEQAFAETRLTAAIQLLVALARTGDAALQPKMIDKLNSLPLERMSEEQLLAATRAYGLTFIRQGKPDAAVAAKVADRLKGLYPHQNEFVNRELCALLVYLEFPGVGEPSMKLLAASQTQEDQLYYVLALRNVAHLLNNEQRRAYFGWLNLAEQTYRGGASFKKFLIRIRDDAARKLPDADRLALKDVIEDKTKVEAVKLETTRQFIHNWQMEDVQEMLAQVDTGRNFEKGKAAYQAAQCYKCHRFNGEGGDTGPDITGVGNRFNAQYILEAVVVPSKVISDQYQSSIVATTGGEVIAGRIVGEDDQQITIRTDPFAREMTVVKKSDIEERQKSSVSEMPQGLINTLTKEEILDMVAYMRAAGKADDKAFLKK